MIKKYYYSLCIVTFNANGHGTAPGSLYVHVGEKISAPTAPTATEYDFDGWYKESTCVNQWDFSADVITENITLYAKWNIKEYIFNVDVIPSGYGKLLFGSSPGAPGVYISNLPHGSSFTQSSNQLTIVSPRSSTYTIVAEPTTGEPQYTYAFKQWNNIPNEMVSNVLNATAEFTRTENYVYVYYPHVHPSPKLTSFPNYEPLDYGIVYPQITDQFISLLPTGDLTIRSAVDSTYGRQIITQPTTVSFLENGVATTSYGYENSLSESYSHIVPGNEYYFVAYGTPQSNYIFYGIRITSFDSSDNILTQEVETNQYTGTPLTVTFLNNTYPVTSFVSFTMPANKTMIEILFTQQSA